MPALKIIFLCSGDQLCRGLIAKNILQSIDGNLDVYSTGITPLSAPSEETERGNEKDWVTKLKAMGLKTIRRIPEHEI